MKSINDIHNALMKPADTDHLLVLMLEMLEHIETLHIRTRIKTIAQDVRNRRHKEIKTIREWRSSFRGHQFRCVPDNAQIFERTVVEMLEHIDTLLGLTDEGYDDEPVFDNPDDEAEHFAIEPIPCKCGAFPSEPVHDPQFGSHIYEIGPHKFVEQCLRCSEPKSEHPETETLSHIWTPATDCKACKKFRDDEIHDMKGVRDYALKNRS